MAGHRSLADNIASMFIEFALKYRARFAIEQKIELAKCSRNVSSEATRSNDLEMANSELDYVAGLLNKFGCTGLSILSNSVPQVRRLGLESLSEIDEDEEDDEPNHMQQVPLHVIPDTS